MQITNIAPISACLAGAVLLLTACDGTKPAPPSAAWPSEAIATVNGTVISEAEFRRLLDQRNHSHRPASAPFQEQKEAVLDELIAFESVYAKAVAAGFDQDPAVSRLIKRLVVTKYREALVEQQSRAPVTEEEARAHYTAHMADFGVPERRRAGVIQVNVPATASAEKRAEAAERAEAARAIATRTGGSSDSFAQAAQKFSDDQATRYRGGDTGWLTDGESHSRLDAAVIRAIFALSNPDEVSPVISTPATLYVVQLLEVQPAGVRPWEEVRELVRYRREQERTVREEAEFLASMKSGLDIQIDRERLADIEPPNRNLAPPALPGGRISGPAPVTQTARSQP